MLYRSTTLTDHRIDTVTVLWHTRPSEAIDEPSDRQSGYGFVELVTATLKSLASARRVAVSLIEGSE